MKKYTILLIALALVLVLAAFVGNDSSLLRKASNATSSNSQGTDSTATIPTTTTPKPDRTETSYVSLGMFQNFGIVGDSYACGAIFVKQENGAITGNTYEELSWGQILARRHGTTCTNFSKGGLSTRNWLTDPMGLAKLLNTEPQNIYYLVLGINDKGEYNQNGKDDFGTIADIKDDFNQNPDTFYGNYGKIIGNIQQHAPNAKIIISTMTGTTSTNKKFNDAIIEIADHFGIPCVKQYEYDFFSSSFYQNNMVYGHPTAAVYSGMANAMEQMFEDAVRENMDYFKDYVG